MKDLSIVNGDLVPGKGGYEVVTGMPKVRQDLTHALVEPFGNDRFHPGWGSLLPRMIGRPSDVVIRVEAQAEVARIVKNYIFVQRALAERLALASMRVRTRSDEIVTGMRFGSVQSAMDQLRVSVLLKVANGNTVTLDVTNKVE